MINKKTLAEASEVTRRAPWGMSRPATETGYGDSSVGARFLEPTNAEEVDLANRVNRQGRALDRSSQ